MGAKRTFFWENLEPEKLWYLVGLITSDGCLSSDERHIDITSKDISLLKSVRQSLGIVNKITSKNNGQGLISFHIQIGSVSFYRFLKAVGLFPNKSLALSDLDVPRKHFNHFLRGLIDGDGCIRHWIHPTNGCEQWSLRICAGSEPFLKWLQRKMLENYGAKGRIHKNDPNSHSIVLKYGKMAGQIILFACYNKNLLALKRKNELACECIAARRGWSKSKTISNNA
jgi:hypothetical protein